MTDTLSEVWTALTSVLWFLLVLPWYLSPFAGLLVNGLVLVLLGGLFARGRYRHGPAPVFESAPALPDRLIVEHHHYHHVMVEHVVTHEIRVQGRIDVVGRQALGSGPAAIESPRVVPGQVLRPARELEAL